MILMMSSDPATSSEATKRKRTASAKLLDLNNDGEIALKSHRDAIALANTAAPAPTPSTPTLSVSGPPTTSATTTQEPSVPSEEEDDIPSQGMLLRPFVIFHLTNALLATKRRNIVVHVVDSDTDNNPENPPSTSDPQGPGPQG